MFNTKKPPFESSKDAKEFINEFFSSTELMELGQLIFTIRRHCKDEIEKSEALVIRHKEFGRTEQEKRTREIITKYENWHKLCEAFNVVVMEKEAEAFGQMFRSMNITPTGNKKGKK